MRSKTYRARTMKEALARVRKDLGGDALILGSREARRKGLFGLSRKTLVEVDAALPAADSAAVSVKTPSLAQAPSPSRLEQTFGADLTRLHAMVQALSQAGRIDHLLPDLPPALAPAYAALLESDAPEILARRLVRLAAERLEPDELDHAQAVARALRDALAEMIPIAPPIPIGGPRRIIALVGPTGVGKTTTVAKLAANIKLTTAARVGLVTVDTYRIAAVEQLRTYAEIIDVPLAVAADPREMKTALEELGDVDLVFIDTAGRGPRDEVKIRELAEFLEEARPDQIHLVLSAAAAPRSLRAAVDRFAVAAVNRIILTKLDELEAPGALLGAVALSTRPISYLTTGQTVPDDIEPANRDRLARLILGQEPLAHSL